MAKGTTPADTEILGNCKPNLIKATVLQVGNLGYLGIPMHVRKRSTCSVSPLSRGLIITASRLHRHCLTEQRKSSHWLSTRRREKIKMNHAENDRRQLFSMLGQSILSDCAARQIQVCRSWHCVEDELGFEHVLRWEISCLYQRNGELIMPFQ